MAMALVMRGNSIGIGKVHWTLNLPANVDTPELPPDAALLETWEVDLSEEFGGVGEVLLVDVVFVEGANEDGEVVVRI